MFDIEVYYTERSKGLPILDCVRTAGGVPGKRVGNFVPVFNAEGDEEPCEYVYIPASLVVETAARPVE